MFVSYRRGASSHVAGRLVDCLKETLGEDKVFFDVDSMRNALGADIRVVLRRVLAGVDVVLVVIGPDWHPERLSDPNDYVRLEISEAIGQGKRVVPVLLDDVPLPEPDQLPEELSNLSFYQAARLRHNPGLP